MPEGENPQPANYNLLSVDDPNGVLNALVALEVCSADESITSITIAGEGNMNLALRVTTDQQSVIVKQSRPWVEKYPSIAAPEERILAELNFYGYVADASEVRASMPSVLAANPAQRLMVLEDLGMASDYASLYSSDVDSGEVDEVFERAIGWVTLLHRCPIDHTDSVGCKPLRKLNHQHIFSLPMLDPPATDLNLVCEGLMAASRDLCADAKVQQAMTSLGELYLKDDGGVLLHGDYYPGSWLKTEAGFRVIDPEFCFAGPQEFDLGVLAAHWIFCGGKADASTIDRVCQAITGEVSVELVKGFAGAELIRRLIGVAQLPLDADLQPPNKMARLRHPLLEAIDLGLVFNLLGGWPNVCLIFGFSSHPQSFASNVISGIIVASPLT